MSIFRDPAEIARTCDDYLTNLSQLYLLDQAERCEATDAGLSPQQLHGEIKEMLDDVPTVDISSTVLGNLTEQLVADLGSSQTRQFVWQGITNYLEMRRKPLMIQQKRLSSVLGKTTLDVTLEANGIARDWYEDKPVEFYAGDTVRVKVDSNFTGYDRPPHYAYRLYGATKGTHSLAIDVIGNGGAPLVTMTPVLKHSSGTLVQLLSRRP